MQVKGVCFHAVQFAINTSLGLSLVKVTLCSCLAVELFDLISVNVEKIAMVCLLITSGESSEDNHVV